MSENSSNEIRDQLPSDLDISAFVGPYQFPDNSRRRIPGYLYLRDFRVQHCVMAVQRSVKWIS